MKYTVCKQFNQKGIGGDFNLRKSTVITEENGILYHNGVKICYKTSKNAYDYFSRNDDGKGQERFALVNEIIDKIIGYVAAYNENRAAIENSDRTDEEKEVDLKALVDRSSQAYETIANLYPGFIKDRNLFTFEFYNADVTDLENIKSLISNL